MRLVRWKRFIWDLTKLSPPEMALPPHFTIRPATKEDHKPLREVVMSAFSLDVSWSDTFALFRGVLESQIDGVFSRPGSAALVLQHGQRIIGASLLNTEMDAESNLLSGPCVMVEYRNRGLGTALLYQSLLTLQKAGLNRAVGMCKENAPAGKFVYRKFGATSESYDPDAMFTAVPAR